MRFRWPKKHDRLELALQAAFNELGIPEGEWDDPGLDVSNTPARMAKMYREELLSSYKPGAHDELVRRFTTFDSDGQDAMVMEGPINFHSQCAHHMLPFSGDAFIGYVPETKLVGASKLARCVEHYSHMLQIQERMARQVADFILKHAEARVCLVLISAQHLCMKCRGVKQQNPRLITTAVRPNSALEDRGIIDEFYRQITIAKQ